MYHQLYCLAKEGGITFHLGKGVLVHEDRRPARKGIRQIDVAEYGRAYEFHAGKEAGMHKKVEWYFT